MSRPARSTLVLGGARSGKSRYGEQLAAAHDGACVYIATAQALDAEMASRIARHRARRGGEWITIEEPLDLVARLRETALPGQLVLIDCVSVWLSNLMAARRDVADEVSALGEAVATLPGRIIIVSNEVGHGIVPDNALARAFRDEAGLANQMLAEVCEEVVFMVAGLAMRVKSHNVQ